MSQSYKKMKLIIFIFVQNLIFGANATKCSNEIVKSGEYWTRPIDQEIADKYFSHHAVILITNSGAQWLLESSINTGVICHKTNNMSSIWTKKHDFVCPGGKTVDDVYKVANIYEVTDPKWLEYIASLTCVCTARRAEQFCAKLPGDCKNVSSLIKPVCEIFGKIENKCSLLNWPRNVSKFTKSREILPINSIYLSHQNLRHIYSQDERECLINLADNENSYWKVLQCGKAVVGLPENQKNDRCIVQGVMGTCVKLYLVCQCGEKSWDIYKEYFEEMWSTMLYQLQIFTSGGLLPPAIPGLELVQPNQVNKKEVLKCIDDLESSITNGNVIAKPLFSFICICFYFLTLTL